jgi:hypothetical protein
MAYVPASELTTASTLLAELEVATTAAKTKHRFSSISSRFRFDP